MILQNLFEKNKLVQNLLSNYTKPGGKLQWQATNKLHEA